MGEVSNTFFGDLEKYDKVIKKGFKYLKYYGQGEDQYLNEKVSLKGITGKVLDTGRKVSFENIVDIKGVDFLYGAPSDYFSFTKIPKKSGLRVL
jgi:hypothetical protein